jgi:hypothetical protein
MQVPSQPRGTPTQLVRQISAHCPFALAQCSVVRDSNQITVPVSARMFEAYRGQRTWVFLRANAN